MSAPASASGAEATATAVTAAASAAHKLAEEIKARILAAWTYEEDAIDEKPNKLVRTDDGSGSDKEGLKRERSSGTSGDRMPFSESQSKWMQTAMVDVMNVFGAHVSERIEQVEVKVEKLDAKVEEHDQKLLEIVAMRTMIGKLGVEMAAVTAKQQELGTALFTSTALTSQASSTTASSAVPHEQRRMGRLGNLGWNDSQDTIVTRAKQVLAEAGATEDEYTNLIATSRTAGSAAEVLFKDATRLQELRLAVRALDKAFSDGRSVWLDVKKKRHEMRPARLTHRATEALEELELDKEDAMTVTKIMNGKSVKVGSCRAAYVAGGLLRWTAFATTRYTIEELAVAKAFAEEE
jgi:hypothetical protein